MKLLLEKVKEKYELSMIIENNKKEKFDYIKFINQLYAGEEIEKIDYDKNITVLEQSQINDMIEQIKEVIRQKS